MIENVLRPEVLLLLVFVCLATFFITRWTIKRKQQPEQAVEKIQIPKKTTDGLAVIEASLITLKSYKNNLNKYGYPYFIETTPIVIQQLKAESDSLIVTDENKLIHEMLEKNYTKLIEFQQEKVDDSKKLELEVLNHVNKTMINWRNYLKEI